MVIVSCKGTNFTKCSVSIEIRSQDKSMAKVSQIIENHIKDSVVDVDSR